MSFIFSKLIKIVILLSDLNFFCIKKIRAYIDNDVDKLAIEAADSIIRLLNIFSFTSFIKNICLRLLSIINFSLKSFIFLRLVKMVLSISDC